jgi:site-specific DNA-methyltransferase (adenine-specific)
MNIPDYIKISNECNLNMMARYPDGFFDLAIVDPPYVVGASDGKFGGKKKKPSKISGKLNVGHYANHDKLPDEKYFKELFRVSKNQIIWGSNYYPQFLNHSGAIVWDKLTTGVLSDCEIAYQSFNKLVFKYVHAWSGFNKGNDKSQRIHPNQKPVGLYVYLLKKFAQKGDKILDTHLGSGSIAIAIDSANKIEKMDLTLFACELHKGFFEVTQNRVSNKCNWQSVF